MKVCPELTPLPEGSEKPAAAAAAATTTMTFEQFEKKHASHMSLLTVKRKAEEEKRKRDQERMDALALKEEEHKRELAKENSKKGDSPMKTPHKEGDESSILEHSKADSPEKKEDQSAFEPVVVTEVKKVEEVKKEEPPLVLPIPLNIPIKNEHIIEQVSQDHFLVLKTTNNIVAGELQLLPLVPNPKTKIMGYYEFMAVHSRIHPQRSVIACEKGALENSILEAGQVPTHTNSYFTNVQQPLEVRDWDAWLKAVSTLEGIGYMNIPPMGVKWPIKIDACIMNVLPLPCEAIHLLESSVPVDHIVMAAAQYEKKILEGKADTTNMFTLGNF